MTKNRWERVLRWVLGCMLVWACTLAAPARAQSHNFAWDVESLPAHSLGQHLQVLRDYGGVWTPEEALDRFAALNPPPPRDEVLSFGIGAPPTWLLLPLHNPHPESLRLHLLLGTTWMDRAEVYLVQRGQMLRRWQLGDELPYAYGVVPGLGFTWELELPRERSELLVRVQSTDPLLLPLRLLDADAFALQRDRVQNSYELIFGSLFALVLYNFVVFAVARNPLHLRYAFYVASLLLLCIAYTGKGLALWWPQSPGFQRYIILGAMVLSNLTGLDFALHFLSLRQWAPRAWRLLEALKWAVAAVMVALVLLDRHLLATWWAFGVFLVNTLVLLALGVWAYRTRVPYGRLYLAAVALSTGGGASAWLAVVGAVPYSTAGYRSMELGFLLEAGLLAFALGRQAFAEDRAPSRG